MLRAADLRQRGLPLLCPSQAIVLHLLGVFLQYFVAVCPGKYEGVEDHTQVPKTMRVISSVIVNILPHDENIPLRDGAASTPGQRL